MLSIQNMFGDFWGDMDAIEELFHSFVLFVIFCKIFSSQKETKELRMKLSNQELLGDFWGDMNAIEELLHPFVIFVTFCKKYLLRSPDFIGAERSQRKRRSSTRCFRFKICFRCRML